MYIFIVNPAAGSGKAQRIYTKLNRHKSFQMLEKKCLYTQYEGHAEELMENITLIHDTNLIQTIVVIGGDGTMHEVLNGLGDTQIPVSFIPGGSGNDFARGYVNSKEPAKIIQEITKNERTTDYWLGVYQTNTVYNRRFINCFGFGFDAIVAKRANQSSLKKICNQFRVGKLVYLFALLRELISFNPINLTIDIDGKTFQFERCLLLTINNQPYFGGGMKINPFAMNNEDRFSLLIVDSISKWKVLALFGTVFIGKHLGFKEVQTMEGRHITITASTSVPYQVDGETGETHFAKLTKQSVPVKVNGLKSSPHKSVPLEKSSERI